MHAAFHVQFGALFPSPIRLDRDLEVGSARIHVSDWPGTLGPVVCLPVLGGSGRSFDTLAAELAPAWRVLALDRRGCGYQVHVADTLALLDLFGFERVVLMGEGFGALIALLLAAWHPARASGLVRIDTGGPPWPESGVDHQELRVLRDCPPDYPALVAAVACPRLDIERAEPARIASFLATVPRRSTD